MQISVLTLLFLFLQHTITTDESIIDTSVSRLVAIDYLRSCTRFTRSYYIYVLLKEHSNRKSTKKFSAQVILLLLLLSGNVHLNPGPPKTPKIPCAICSKSTTTKQLSINCDICKQPTHRTCANLSLTEYRILNNTVTPWKCAQCKDLVNIDIYPCGVCNFHVPEDNFSILCDLCNHWIHLSCTGLSKEQLMCYEGEGIYYACPNCALPFNNTDISLGSSFLLDNDSTFYSMNSSSSSQDTIPPPACAFLNQLHPKNFKVAHLNINSFKNKFYDCVDVLHSGVFDIIAFSETKLGPSFYTKQYLVNSYKPPIRVDNSTRSPADMVRIFTDHSPR